MNVNQSVDKQPSVAEGALGVKSQESTSSLCQVESDRPQAMVRVSNQELMRNPAMDVAQRRCESLSTLSGRWRHVYTPRKDFFSLFYDVRSPSMLTQSELDNLLGVNESLTLAELNEVYLPIVERITLKATEHLKENPSETFIIGIAGSVAVGKSTSARVIHALLARNFERAALVSTDNFLYPTAVLEEKEIMHRKGFPESFDQEAMLDFFQALKNNQADICVPIYDHISYDILKDRTQVVSHPEILVLEGLNVLQPYKTIADDIEVTYHFSDHLHYSIYVDAKSEDIKQWYVERFLSFRNSNLSDKNSRWQKYAGLSEQEVVKKAEEIWDSINGLNLKDHIEPSKDRADLIIEKSADHAVRGINMKTMPCSQVRRV